jgi:DNA invertase Pin-like site-specific DNA recombinase
MGAGKVFREVASGAKADRASLRRLLDQLAPGDVVTATRIDRLARSTFDLFAIVKRIVDAKAQFRSLAEPWADTGTSTGRLMLAVLGALADVEGATLEELARSYNVSRATISRLSA